VAILPDNDQAGWTHAGQVAAGLHGVAASVRIVELPGLPPKGDGSDWLDAGGTAETLRALVDQAPAWKPSDSQPSTSGDAPGDNVAEVATLRAQLAQRDEIIAVQRAELQARAAEIARFQQRDAAVRAIVANKQLQGNAVRVYLAAIWYTDNPLQEGNPQPIKAYGPKLAEMAGVSEDAVALQLKRLDAAPIPLVRRESFSVRKELVDPETGRTVMDPDTGKPKMVTRREVWITRLAPTVEAALQAGASATLGREATTGAWGGSQIPRCKEHPGAPVSIRRVVTCTVCDAMVRDTTELDPKPLAERKPRIAVEKYERNQEESPGYCKPRDAVCTPEDMADAWAELAKLAERPVASPGADLATGICTRHNRYLTDREVTTGGCSWCEPQISAAAAVLNGHVPLSQELTLRGLL